MKETQNTYQSCNSMLHNEENVSSTIVKHNKKGLEKNLLCASFYTNIMSSIISEIKDKLSPISPITRNVFRLRLNSWVIKGEEKTTKQEIKVLFTGRDLSRYYIEDLVFSNIIEERYIGRKWIWTTLRMARKNYADCSLLIAETGDILAKLFRRKQELFIPCWIVGEIDINANSGDSIQKHRGKGIMKDIRRIKRNKLDYEITNKQAQYREFYHNMYKPFAIKRYGNKADVESYQDLNMSFKKGELLLVKMGGVPVAGTLIKYKKNQAFLCVLGVKDGDSSYLKFGTTAALYYYSIKYLRGKGFKRVDIGATRPFLMDGVLRYKKKWGLKIIRTSGPGFLIKPLSEKAVVKGFLLTNPFIFKDSGNIYGAVFLPPEQVDSQKSVERVFNSYYIDGMSKLIIYAFDGDDNVVRINIPDELSNKIIVLRADELYQKT